MQPTRHTVAVIAGVLALSGGGLWLALDRTADKPGGVERASRTEAAAPGGRGGPSDTPGRGADSGDSSQSGEVRTEIVRALLKELDHLGDATPEEKRELRRLLLDVDKQLAEATIPPRIGPESQPQKSGKYGSKGPLGHKPGTQDVPNSAQKDMDKADGPRTPIVKALLELVNDLPTANLSDEEKDQRAAVRDGLLRADTILSQHLGQAAVDRIKAANEKHPAPRVFNPRKRPPAEGDK